MKLPQKIPADPRPAIARPKMNAVEFGEMAQTKLPSSKTPIAHRYVHLRLNDVYRRPQRSWQEQFVRK